MSVYVDSPIYPYGRMFMCHMTADTFEELHAMADAIGIRRKWFQGDHYDICKSKRAVAVRMGAIECHGKTIIRVVRQLRARPSAKAEG